MVRRALAALSIVFSVLAIGASLAGIVGTLAIQGPLTDRVVTAAARVELALAGAEAFAGDSGVALAEIRERADVVLGPVAEVEASVQQGPLAGVLGPLLEPVSGFALGLAERAEGLQARIDGLLLEVRAARDTAHRVRTGAARWIVLGSLALVVGLAWLALGQVALIRWARTWWWETSGGTKMNYTSTEAAVEALRNKKLDVLEREDAAFHIQDHPSPEGIEALVVALCDDQPGLRWVAGTVLARLGEQALPALLRGLTSSTCGGLMLEGARHVLHYNGSPKVRELTRELQQALRGPAAQEATMEAAYKLKRELGY